MLNCFSHNPVYKMHRDRNKNCDTAIPWTNCICVHYVQLPLEMGFAALKFFVKKRNILAATSSYGTREEVPKIQV